MNFSHESTIEAPVLKRIQVTFLAGALVFFSWGWILRVAVPGAWDSWTLRACYTVLCLVAYVVSVRVPSQKRFVVPLYHAILTLGALFLWVQLHQNGYGQFYYAVFTVASSALTIAALSFRAAVLIAFLQSLLVVAGLWGDHSKDPQFLAFTFVTLCALWLPTLMQYSTQRAFQLVWQSGQEFSQILNSLHEGLILQDRSGNIVYFNQLAPRILGLSPDQIRGKTSLDPSWKCVTADRTPLAGAEHPAMVTLRTREPVINYTMGVYRPNGDLRWIRVSTHPVRKDMYAIMPSTKLDSLEGGVLIAFEDITEQKTHEEDLARTRSVVRDTARLTSLGEAAAGIAHEINNPLAVVMLKVEQLLEVAETDAPALLQDLKHVQASAQRITKMVKSVRSLSRDASQDPNMPKNVQELSNEILSVYAERLKHAGIEAQIQIEPGLVLLCRPSQIGQVLTNMMHNSIDAIQEAREGRDKNEPARQEWIRISARRLQDGGMELVFEDSGPGIPEIIRKRVLEPFFTTKPQGKGTGLGLSISHSIIQAHLGTFEIDGSAQGARFKMVFPATVVSGEEKAA